MLGSLGRSSWFCALLGASSASLLATATARAEVSSIVFELDGDSAYGDVARNLSGALRQAVSQRPGWSVRPIEVSLSQVLLANDCAEPNAACLGRAAEDFGAERVFFGTLQRVPGESPAEFGLLLYVFDASTNTITGPVSRTITRARSDIDDLREPAREAIAELLGRRDTGALRVVVRVEGAEVYVNRELVGTAEMGEVAVESIPSGRHYVEVRAEGFRTIRRSVEIGPGERVSLEADLQRTAEEAEPAGGPNWAGIGAVGASGVMLSLTAYTWLRMESIESDDEFTAYRAPLPSNQDGCEVAERAGGRTPREQYVIDLCGEADTLEVLQYVFLGGGLLAGGIGTYLLATDDDGREERRDEQPLALRVRPGLAKGGARVTAELRF